MMRWATRGQAYSRALRRPARMKRWRRDSCSSRRQMAQALDVALKAGSQASFADENKTGMGVALANLGDGTQQVFRAFAFFEATDKEDILLPVHELQQWWHIRAETFEADAVGYDTVIGGKVARDELACGCRNGDAPGEFAKNWAQQGIEIGRA